MIIRRKQIEAGAWLALAKSKDKARENLWLQHGHTTADGFRMHVAPDAQEVLCTCALCEDNERNLSVIRDAKIPSKGFALDRDALLAVVKVAKDAFGKNQYALVRLEAGPGGLVVRWHTDDAVFEAKVKGKLAWFSRRVRFALSPAFLYDALLGIRSSLAHFHNAHENAPVTIVEDPEIYETEAIRRKAIIMPMTWSDWGPDEPAEVVQAAGQDVEPENAAEANAAVEIDQPEVEETEVLEEVSSG